MRCAPLVPALLLWGSAAAEDLVWVHGPAPGKWYACQWEAHAYQEAIDCVAPFGATLVSVGSAAEHRFLLEVFPGMPEHWLGLRDSCGWPEACWAWVDGSRIEYLPPGFSLEGWVSMDCCGQVSQLPDGSWTIRDENPWDGLALPSLVELDSSDCDGDGVPDAYEIALGLEPDENGNGVIDGCECHVERYCRALPNSTGEAAHLFAEGSLSLAEAELALTVEGLPPEALVLFFYGGRKSDVVFGDGRLCVAPPHARILPVLGSDLAGRVALLLDFDAPPLGAGESAVEPFSVWNFQVVYRDPGSAGAGCNATDALELRFCP